jgi:hypothetical protein
VKRPGKELALSPVRLAQLRDVARRLLTLARNECSYGRWRRADTIAGLATTALSMALADVGLTRGELLELQEAAGYASVDACNAVRNVIQPWIVELERERAEGAPS